jgi:hypothetical protein
MLSEARAEHAMADEGGSALFRRNKARNPSLNPRASADRATPRGQLEVNMALTNIKLLI